MKETKVKREKKTSSPSFSVSAEKREDNRAADWQGNHRKNSSGRLLLWTSCLIVFFSLYTVIGWFGIPVLFKSIAVDRLQQATGLSLSAGKLTFNPWTFTFTGNNLVLSEKGQAPLLTLREVKTRLSPLPLLRAEWVCRSVQVLQADIDIRRRKNGLYNMGSLLRTYGRNRDYEIMDFSELPFYFSLNNIEIENSRLLFSDIPSGRTHSVDHISLHLPTLSNFNRALPRHVTPAFSAIVDGTPVEIQSRGKGANAVLSTRIHDFDIAKYDKFIPTQIPFQVSSGILNGTVEITFHSPDTDNHRTLNLIFAVNAADLTLNSRKGVKKISLHKAQLSGSYNSTANTLTLENASIFSPDITASLPDRESCVHAIFPSLRETASPGTLRNSNNTIPETNIFTLVVKQFKLSQGTLLLRGEKNADRWKNISLNAENLFADTRHKADAPETASGNFDFTATRDIKTARKSGGKSSFKFSLRGLVAPYHRAGIPEIHDAWFVAENLRGLRDLSSVFDSPLSGGEALRLTAGRTEIGPVDTRSVPIQLGTINLQHANATLTPDDIPLTTQILLSIPPPFSLQALHYEGDFELHLKRKGKPCHWHFSRVHFALDKDPSVKGDGWPKQMNTRYHAILRDGRDTLESATVEGRGTIGFWPFIFSSEIDFKDFQLERELAFLTSTRKPDQPAVTGTLSGRGLISFPDFRYSGKLFITDGALVNDTTTPLMRWKKLTADNVLYQHHDSEHSEEMKVGMVNIFQPAITLNFAPDSPPLKRGAELRSLALAALPSSLQKVNSLKLQQGNLLISDSRTMPPWKEVVSEFSGEIGPFFPGETSELHFTGILNEAKFSIKGTTNTVHPQQDSRLAFIADQIPLSLFKNQIEEGGLISGSSGVASIEMNTLWMAGTATSHGSLLLNGLKAFNPLSNTAAAIALLNGGENNSKIMFNFSGGKAEKESLVSFILQTLQKKLLHSEAAPLLMAAPEFQNIATQPPIIFAPGKSEIDARDAPLLASYARLLKTYPNLVLVLTASANNTKDNEALLKQLRKKLGKKAAKQVKVTERLLNALAQKRCATVAEALQTLLKDERATERIQIEPADKLTESNPAVHVFIREKRATLSQGTK